LFLLFFWVFCRPFPGGKDYTPSRGELTRHVSLGRRGITTVQPGMEDFEGGGEHDDHDEINGIAVINRDGRDLPPVKKTMLGKIASKLRRHKDHKGDTPPDSSHLAVDLKNTPSSSPSVRPHPLMRSHSDGSGRATSPPSHRSQPDSSSPPSAVHKTFNVNTNNNSNESSAKKTPTKPLTTPTIAATNNNNNKKSDKVKNTEASMLRQQIAATEYELTRFAKSIRKKVIHNSNEGGKPEKNQVTAEEYASLQGQQSELQQKLQKLRREHVELTGLTYEQAKAARSTLGRLLGGRKQQHSHQAQHSHGYDNSYIPTAEATTVTEATVVGFESASSAQGSPSKEQMKHYFTKEISNRLARPAHWLTYK
jgi:hypothetical protein